MSKLFEKTRTFLEMIKFEHSIFALPFAYLGLFLGERAGGRAWPRPGVFLWVSLAMVSFRTLGMALNRLIDQKIDGLNPRTQNRALPAGKLQAPFVWAVTAAAFAIFVLTVSRLPRLCGLLAPLPLFLAALYPWTKRFTWLSHLVLGMILGIAPYGAWLATGQGFSWIPGLVTLGVTAWVAGFDMIYALQDVEFDRKERLYSFPAIFGPESAVWMTRGLHFLTLGAWFLAGRLAGLGPVYFAGLGLVFCLLVREHWLIRSSGLEKLNEAFFTMNAMVSLAVFLAMVLDISLLH